MYVHMSVYMLVARACFFFLSDVADPPPEGVIFNDVLVQIPDRKVLYVPIPVTNTTDHTFIWRVYKSK